MFGANSLHATGVELASRHGYSDHTGGEGKEQSVARPVQSQRQQLPGLRRVSGTPATHKQAKSKTALAISIISPEIASLTSDRTPTSQQETNINSLQRKSHNKVMRSDPQGQWVRCQSKYTLYNL